MFDQHGYAEALHASLSEERDGRFAVADASLPTQAIASMGGTLFERLEQRGLQYQRRVPTSVPETLSAGAIAGPEGAPNRFHTNELAEDHGSAPGQQHGHTWCSPPPPLFRQLRKSSPLSLGSRHASDEEEDETENEGDEQPETCEEGGSGVPRKRRSGPHWSPALSQSGLSQVPRAPATPYGRSMPSLRNSSGPACNDKSSASCFRRSALFDGPTSSTRSGSGSGINNGSAGAFASGLGSSFQHRRASSGLSSPCNGLSTRKGWNGSGGSGSASGSSALYGLGMGPAQCSSPGASSLHSPSSLSASLVGSYEESLLSGRMSAAKSKPLMFDAEIGVLGTGPVAPPPSSPHNTERSARGADGVMTADDSARNGIGYGCSFPPQVHVAGTKRRMKSAASLRCPKHVSMKFPAHFYNLPSARPGSTDLSSSASGGSGRGSTMLSDASINSPYVGNIDLEGHYMNQLIDAHLRMMGIDGDAVPKAEYGTEPANTSDPVSTQASSASGHERKDSTRNALPAFPGYRVPPKGQIQLIIKNPNSMAVKVFLVPYDLSTMECGRRTFVRQKCYVQSPPNAAGGIVHQSTATSPKSSFAGTSQQGKDALRYAVHLQFCSPPADYGMSSKKRAAYLAATLHGAGTDVSTAVAEQRAPKIYLHRIIRVVFTARLPDKSEKLTTVTETLNCPPSPQMNRNTREVSAAQDQQLSSSPQSFSDASGGPVSPHMDRPQPLYASYAGPGDEWNRALREAKIAIKQAEKHRQKLKAAERAAALPSLEQMQRGDFEGKNGDDHDEMSVSVSALGIPIEWAPPSGRDLSGYDANGSFGSPFTPLSEPNSDPNGERWRDEIEAHVGASRTCGETVAPAAVLGLHLHHVASDGQRTAMSDARPSTSSIVVPPVSSQYEPRRTRAQTFASGSSGSPPLTSCSLAHLENVSVAQEGRGQPSAPALAAVADDSRALLEAWHQSLRRRAASPLSSSRPVSGRASPEVMRYGSPVPSPSIGPTSPSGSGSGHGHGHTTRGNRGLTVVYQRPSSRSENYMTASVSAGYPRLPSQSNLVADEDVPPSDYIGRHSETSSSSSHTHGQGLLPQTPTTSPPVIAQVTPLSAMAVMAHSAAQDEKQLPDIAALSIQPLQAPSR
ncbi:hypothetical protein K437DRAFT_263884 [Tilletiaria anomala UBC 951]|uniref:Atos-like conserved domain-containing protein n=1 Tax=Tilletiaria anomala (strain ATCC 24038 / CBS 436.72 / UBC 951) TaxID=1037660 RepID=A0A066VKH9_TILAU|nr:uncharacterized protein K437DRAFT_263884 [Tilletiaria anomala UBC 951]KDN41976.1 hypothetical protein K437DRAFT_263884 [Tilletiaria anomala UBC 951]